MDRHGSTRDHGCRTSRFQDFATEEARRLVAAHDFLLTVGNNDANPSTILEAMAWGLVPVCTPTSGYVGYPGILNVPLHNPVGAAAVLNELQTTPEGRLIEMQQENWAALDTHFTWKRFAEQVVGAVRSGESPALLREPLHRKIWLRAAALTSPYSLLRPANLRLLLAPHRRKGP